MDYYDVLLEEFSKETDRAAVILTASIVDELLRTLLSARLVPVSSSTDDLFDGANSPPGTFSSRVEMSFRVGLISAKFARDLHLMRKIRNEFAHNIQGCSFEDAKVRSRVTELNNSNGIIGRSPGKFPERPSTRDQFLEAAGWMIFSLDRQIHEVTPMIAAIEEWGYDYSHDENYEALADNRSKNAPKPRVKGEKLGTPASRKPPRAAAKKRGAA